MSVESILNDVAEVATKALGALTPAALGAVVAQIHERGLGWRDRLLAMLAGICVSYYVTLALAVWFGLDPFIAQAVGFVLAMIAHKATPRVIESLSAIAGEVPADIFRRVFPKKGGDQ